jgi:hypothetical protein
LTITGHGFQYDNVEVTVDGISCIVTQQHETSLSCEI